VQRLFLFWPHAPAFLSPGAPWHPPPQLHKLRRLYGSNVCGEGGEYESLTLDCPALFTAARIVLDGWQAVEVSRDSLAPVALLHPTAFHLEDKAPAAGAEAAAAAAAPAVVTVPEDWVPQEASMPPAALAQAEAEAASGGVDVKAHVVDGSSYCSLSAVVTAAGGSAGPDPTSAAGTVAALTAALEMISGMLPGLGLDWGASLFLHLYVPAMAQFAAANAAYSAFLPEVNPPSRATVQLSGGTGLALVVEALFAR
jgi:diphthine-ammonia ligase